MADNLDSNGMSHVCAKCHAVLSAMLLVVTVTQANHHARRLYDEKIKESGYNMDIPPMRNVSEKIWVKLGLKISQLIDVVRSLTLKEMTTESKTDRLNNSWKKLINELSNNKY